MEKANVTQRKVRVGVAGLGNRGASLTKMILAMPDVEVVALSDVYQDRVDDMAKSVEKATGKKPFATTDAHELIAEKGMDALFIFTGWEAHVELAVEAMEAGLYVGMEVGGAYTIEDCWKLVDTYERTGAPLMLLENCCYGEYELMVLRMVREGVFGAVSHCSGGYCHDLREEIATGEEKRHYRLRNYLTRNCENYPTHEIGPIAKVLNLNRGNRMTELVSISSKAQGLSAYIADKMPQSKYNGAAFAQGDVVNTIIRCEHGETIAIKLDTTLPRFYSRAFTVQGTKGMYQEDGNIVFLDGVHNRYHFHPKLLWNNAKRYLRKYSHPIWKKFRKEGVRGGHGGMDYLVLRAFLESVKGRYLPPIDVYDAASWMAITALSEKSIKKGGAPVAFPDFTRGSWQTRKGDPAIPYALDE